jgi:hypothetical protein
MDRLTPATFREGSIHSVGIEALSGPKQVALWANPHEKKQRVWELGTRRVWQVNSANCRGQGVNSVLADIENAWKSAGVVVRYWTVYPYAPAIRPHFQVEGYKANHGGAINAYLVFKRRKMAGPESDMGDGDEVTWYVRTDCSPEGLMKMSESYVSGVVSTIVSWLTGFGLRYAHVGTPPNACVGLNWRWQGKRLIVQNSFYLDI